MKIRIFTILLLLASATAIKSQYISQVQNSLDEKTGYWRISEGDKASGTNSNPLLYGWQSVTTPLNTQFLGICFVDSLYGWVSNTNNGSMRSTDGGFTWTVTTFNDTNFTGAYNSVFFLDRNTGWCTGSAIQIRKTTNGGANWFKQYGPPVAGIAHSIYFFDVNTGYIVGSKSYNPFLPCVVKTTNSGNNWFEISPSFSGAQNLNDQFWFDANTGWSAGRNALLKTTNGGLNFTNYFANVPPTGNGQNELLCIWFVNQQTGWIGGSNLENQNIYKTTNAGINWVFQPNPVSQNNYYAQINDMIFFSPDSGWAVHGTPATGAIMFTSNGGNNWVIEQGNVGWFQCITYYQRLKAWCGADGGNVWYTNMTQPLGISNNNNEIPKEFSLYQNFPNPFNPSTKIRFDVSSNRTLSETKGLNVQLIVYDILGKEVKTLINEQMNPGSYEVDFNASDLPSSVYFYRLVIGSFTQTKKMMLIK
jgi:photosystem II stability/assembly factor-like uncharacterized protein